MQNYEPNADQIVALYQQLEDDILRSMVRRMLKMGYVSESTKYEAEVLQTAGLLYDDIIQLIAERTDASVQQVRALFEDAGMQTVEIDNEVHGAVGEVPVDIRQDAGMKQVLEAGYKKTLGTMRNLISTTATEAQNTFIQACDRAYMQVSSGAFSYQEAIRQAVVQAAADGATVRYPSGHTDRIDVAVRRAVLTGVHRTAVSVALEHAKQSGCYLMELTAHSSARPDHAKWQGQLVSLTSQNVGRRIDGLHVFSLREIGYGRGEGFCGWNCRHNWHPYYPGLSTPNYTKEQIAKLDEKSISYNGEKYTEYEITQMQRKGERKVRALKRKAVSLDEAVKAAAEPELKQRLTDDFTAVSVRLKDAESQLKDFCQATGRRRDRFREQTLGFDRSISQKAIQSTKADLTHKDYNDIIHMRGKMSDRDVRLWYVTHDKSIPNLIDRTKSIEEQAKQACNLRNQYRYQARELMADQEKRKQLDVTDPIKSFDELMQHKMKDKGLSYEEALEDIVKTATKTRKSVNDELGVEG